MQRHLNANPGDGKKGGKVGGSVCVWGALKEEKIRNEKGRETNVRAAVHEIKKMHPKYSCLRCFMAGLPGSLCLPFYLSAGKAYVRRCNL